MKTVLLTNDDGIGARGLEVLAEVVAALPSMQMWTVAPAQDQSGRSHAVSLLRPMNVHRIGPTRYAVEGTSADCVILAGNSLMPRPDLVVCGINAGPNLGDDLHYSATAGAAAEAALQGIPAVAVSLAWDFTDPGRGRGWHTAARVASALLARPELLIADGRFWNVNVPDVPSHELRGLVRSPLGRRRFETSVAIESSPREEEAEWHSEGGPSGTYTVTVRHLGHTGPAGNDLSSIAQGYAAVTPIAVTGHGAHGALHPDLWKSDQLAGFPRGILPAASGGP